MNVCKNILAATLLCVCWFAVSSFALPPLRDPVEVFVQELLKAGFSVHNDDCGWRPLQLNYSLFRTATSSLHLLSPLQKSWLRERHPHAKQRAALGLMLGCQADAAHEIILGISLDNIEEAERVAALPQLERQAYGWIHKYPLSDTDDWIHSLIHRREGSQRGEGNHTGWDNAKYWAAGGPKAALASHQPATSSAQTPPPIHTPTLCNHIVSRQLADYVKEHAPICWRRGLVVTDAKGRQHRIISGGAKYQQVCVPVGCWDPFCFIDLLTEQQQKDNLMLQEELKCMQHMELELLLTFCKAVGNEKE